MRKSLELSAIAMLTTALTVLPAHALSLNLGGDGPLVDLGNGNNADATVSVDTGDVLGTDTGGDTTDADATIQVNLGDSNSSSTSTSTSTSTSNLNSIIDDDGDGGLVNLGSDSDLIDLNGQGDSVIDLGGNGNLLDLGGDGDLLDLGGGKLLDLGGGTDGVVDLAGLDLGDGLLLDLTGDGNAGGVIDVDLGGGDLLDPGETGGILDLDGAGDLLDLGGSGDLLDLGGGNLLDLGGSSDDLVALDLGNTQVGVDLNPDGGSAPLAKVTISTDESGVAGTGVLPGTSGLGTLGGGNAAALTLTGDNGGSSSGDGSDGANGAGDGNGNGAGDGSGSDGSGNGNGNDGNGNGTGGSANDNGGSGNGGNTAFAALADGDKCLTLDARQLDQLIDRHAYNRATFNSWASTRSLKIVEVDFCDREVAEVAAAAGGSANVARLQAFLAAQAKVQAGLQSKGHSAGDVIAADHSGEVLIVYVI